MIKTVNILETVIAGLIAAAVVGIGSYLVYIPVLKSQIEDLKTTQENIPSQINSQITQLTTKITELENKSIDLEKKYYLIAGFLQAKLNFNVQMFIDIAAKKGISPQQFKTVIPILEQNPKEFGSFLQNKLQFTPDEVKAVMSVPPYGQPKF